MFPRFPQPNHGNSIPAHSERTGEFFVGQGGIPNKEHVAFGKFCCTVRFSMARLRLRVISPLGNHVNRIDRVIAKKEVIRIYAISHVARMTNHRIWRNGINEQFIRQAVRVDCSVCPSVTVSAFANGTSPQPTISIRPMTGSFINLLEKAFSDSLALCHWVASLAGSSMSRESGRTATVADSFILAEG